MLIENVVYRSYVINQPYALPSEKYHRLLKDIEREFDVDLLDLTLSLETDGALGVTVGGGRPEIEHVENVERTPGDVSESESEDQASDAGSELPEDMVSSAEFSGYAPSSADSSDSESSSESSFVHSPIMSQFPNTIVHSHPAVIESFTAQRSIFNRLTRQDSESSSSDSIDEPLSKSPVADRAAMGRPTVVGYGAM